MEATITQPTRLLLTVNEAAQCLGVSRSTMFGLIREGEVESVLIRSSRLVPYAGLHAYVDRLRNAAKAA